MAIDTSFGEVRKFEDFLVTGLAADLTEIDLLVSAGGTTEIVAAAADGRISIVNDAGNDGEIGGISFGDLNWLAGSGYLKMEARIFIDDITSYDIFVGFGDKIVSGDETIFTISGDVESSGTQSDAIGFFYNVDATTDVWRCMAQATDVITSRKELVSRYNVVADEAMTLGVYLSLDRKSAVWYVNGEEVYRIDANSTALVAAVGLVPIIQMVDQSTATTCQVDYLYGAKGRSTT